MDEEAAKSQQRKVEAEQAEWARQRTPTRGGCLGSCLAMVVVVAGSLLLVPAAFATLFGLGMMGTDFPPFNFDTGLGMFVVGLVGLAAAVLLLAIGVRVWRSSE